MEKMNIKKEEVIPEFGMRGKISKPQNQIIERLQRQLKNVAEINEVVSSYSRMHNRHNRSWIKSVKKYLVSLVDNDHRELD